MISMCCSGVVFDGLPRIFPPAFTDKLACVRYTNSSRPISATAASIVPAADERSVLLSWRMTTSYLHVGQQTDYSEHVGSVAAEAVQLGDHQHVLGPQLLQHPAEFLPLASVRLAAHRVRMPVIWLISCRMDLQPLVLRGLVGC